MNSIKFNENGLNVEYVSQFIEKESADRYFKELQTLPFYTPTFKLRGRNAKPKRQVLAYGDSNTVYAFSGISIPAVPWTPLMLELRDYVEKHTACTFNYVLLNLYMDGSSFISPHKDDESGLDETFPISVLSFGAKRTISFTRPKIKPTHIKLEHGSLYSMKKPTNELYTHGIAREPAVNCMRISLTFRRIIPLISPSKKPRLERDMSLANSQFGNDSDLLKESESATAKPSPLEDINCTPQLQPPKELIYVKQSSNPVHEVDSSEILLYEWDLNKNTFLHVMLEKNFHIRIYIRRYNESVNDDRTHTKMSVVMTPLTWYLFQGKLVSNFKLELPNDSFIANNQLLVASVSEEYYTIQQMFPLNTLGFFLKPSVVKLSKEQISNLFLNYKITETIIEAKFLKVLPRLIFKKKSSTCFNHVSTEIAKQNLMRAIAFEVKLCANSHYKCFGCRENLPSQKDHGCIMEHLILKFHSNRQLIFLTVNLSNIANNLACYCQYNEEFFENFNPFVHDYMELENALEELSQY